MPATGPRIGISGSYGGYNLGDEAILAGILRPLRVELDADVVVFSRDPEDTRRRHGVAAVAARTMSRDESREVVRGLDLLILGGGGILFDEEVPAFLREVNLAHELGVPVVVYAVSAGPLRDPDQRTAVRDALNRCAAVTVRDRPGQRLLQEIGVGQPVVLTADPALLLEAAPLPADALRREGLDHGRRLVGISVREPGPAAPDIDVAHYHGLLADAADYVVDRFDADVVFVPMERKKSDVQQSHAVVAEMNEAQRATVLKGEYGAAELLALVGNLDFAIGMRLHFLIFAALQGVPFVALPYASKVSGFLDDLEVASAPLAGLGAGTLIAHIDRSWDRRAELRARIAERLPALQVRACETHRIVARVLASRGLPPARSEAC
jgi:polysaccharide pyruvyl transferase CsaB